ncbi:MAG: hypothetical protein MR286_05165 [Clostridiales bacterium]|nr:hypothetical protein [Clostridiales bacterium]
MKDFCEMGFTGIQRELVRVVDGLNLEHMMILLDLAKTFEEIEEKRKKELDEIYGERNDIDESATNEDR